MPLDIILIAKVAVSVLIPFLLEMGQSASKKMAEKLGEKSGEAIANTGQGVWKKLIAHPQAKGIVEALARKPDDPKRKDIAIEDLTAYLKENPSLARELNDLIGRQTAIQKIIADKGGSISDATQALEGSGEQTIIAKNKGKIENVRQTKKR